MEKIIDEENKLTFDIEKFLNEDTKEDNELGFQLTCSILTKAWKKGVEEGFNHGYDRGYRNSGELTQKICEKATDRILNAESTSYDTGFKKALMMIQWYNKIFLGIDTDYDIDKIKRLYEKYKGE